jgi:hypothetical protein
MMILSIKEDRDIKGKIDFFSRIKQRSLNVKAAILFYFISLQHQAYIFCALSDNLREVFV